MKATAQTRFIPIALRAVLHKLVACIKVGIALGRAEIPVTGHTVGHIGDSVSVRAPASVNIFKWSDRLDTVVANCICTGWGRRCRGGLSG